LEGGLPHQVTWDITELKIGLGQRYRSKIADGPHKIARGDDDLEAKRSVIEHPAPLI